MRVKTFFNFSLIFIESFITCLVYLHEPVAPVWLRQSVELALAEDLGEVELRREPAAHPVVRPLAELQVAEGGRPVPLEDKTSILYYERGDILV